MEDNATLTFFRKGALKKFFIGDSRNLMEQIFFEAVEIIECKEDEKKEKIDDTFYTQLEKNKKALMIALETGEVSHNEVKTAGHDANIKKVLKALKSYRGFTDIEEEKIEKYKELWDNGAIPVGKTKEVLKNIEGMTEPVKILNTIIETIPQDYVQTENKSNKMEEVKTEVILSMYLKG